MTGKLFSNGMFLKWSSMLCAPLEERGRRRGEIGLFEATYRHPSYLSPLGLSETGVHVLHLHEELLHDIEPILERQGEDADGRAHAVASADPVPEPKGVVRVDPKLLDELQVGAHGHHML